MMWRDGKSRFSTGMIQIGCFTAGYPDEPAALKERITDDFSSLGLPHVFGVEGDTNLHQMMMDRKMSFEKWACIRTKGHSFFAFMTENDCIMARLLI
jgi:hypothetical protein